MGIEGYAFRDIETVRKLLALIDAAPDSGVAIGDVTDSPTFREGVWSPLACNRSSEVVPPFAAMAIDGVETSFTDRHTLKIIKPATDKFRPVVFNGPHEIAVNKRGPCWASGVVRAKYAAGQSFTANQVVGVTGWEIKSDGRRDAMITVHGIVNATSRTALVRVDQLQSGTVFPVTMTQTGGVDGTSTAKATWTYTVLDEITGASLGTNVNPTIAPHADWRPAAGNTHKATHGLAIFNVDGVLALRSYNEFIVVESC